MADPISSAGFAIGAVSLGIQVCQGLVSYYNDWKSCDDDISRIIGKLRGLEKTLKNLKNGMTRCHSADAKEVADVNEKILLCDDGIHRLQAVLDKCRSLPSSNGVHKFLQKTLYPFRKTTLHELEVGMSDLQGILHTGLLSLLIGASNDQREDLSFLISTAQTRNEKFEEARHDIHSTATEVRGVHDGVKSIQQQTDIIRASTSSIISTLVMGFENLQLFQQNSLLELNDRVGTLTELLTKSLEDQFQGNKGLVLSPEPIKSQSTAAVQKNFRSIQARLIEKPSLLRAACGNIDRLKDLPQSQSMMERRANNSSSFRRFFKRPNCSCSSSAYSSELRRPHRSQPHGPIWGVRFNSSTVIHHKGCALFKDAETEKAWKLRVLYCGRIIAQAITMSIDLRWGAGGYAISPSLSCDRIVSSDSSIFQITEKYCPIALHWEMPRLAQVIDSLIRSMGQLYQERKASVHDVDEEGNNIVQRIVKCTHIFPITEENTREFLRLFKYFYDCGVRVERVNAQGMTCVDEWQCRKYFMPLSVTDMMVEGMMDLGAEVVGINNYNTLTFAENVRRYEELAEARSFNDICRAVLRRSEPELQKVLQNSHHLIDESNAGGLRPLHISAGWPRGVEILMSHRANINVIDDDAKFPVEHAIYLCCQQSLALFAEADCVLTPSSRNSKGTLELALFASISNYDNDQASRISLAQSVIIMEANQRRKLQALISRHLPESSICTHSSSKDRLLDVYAFDAVVALKQRGVSIPSSLELDEYCGTVYHLPGLRKEILNSLWEAGFRDINEPDPSGRTPLFLNNLFCGFETLTGFFERLIWFLDKGVDPDTKLQHIHQNSYWSCNSKVGCPCTKSGHTTMHFIAFNLDICRKFCHGLRYLYQSLDLEDSRLVAALKDVFNNEPRDACKCACSSAGCRAINITVKLNHSTFRDLEDYFRSAIRPVPTAKANDFISEATFSEMIRSLTFNALGLTHTCCRKNENWTEELQLIPFEDEDDISEIHDEEREDLQLLEELLLEFELERRCKPSSFHKFMAGYWLTRMREVLCEKGSEGVSSEEESLSEESEEGSLDEVSEEESLDEISGEESLDERDAVGYVDDTSSRQSHRVTEVQVHDDSEG